MSDPGKTNIDFEAARVKFPGDEGKFDWLPMLLDAYAIVDTGVSIAVKEHAAECGVRLACRRGCDACCRSQTDIPLYPLELVGIYWYSAEKITGDSRKALKERLLFHNNTRPCPFLSEGACTIHPIRPVSCRQFNVFSEPCSEGEDPYFARRKDVLAPKREYTNEAFRVMLPFYRVGGGGQEQIDRIIHEEIINLKQVDWKRLYAVMEGFESRNPEVLR